MSSSPELQPYRRTFAVTLALLGVVALGIGRLTFVQLTGHSAVASNSADLITLPAMRGSIYDQHGYLLAASSLVYDIGAVPALVPKADKGVVADRLAPLLGKSRTELFDLLTADATFVQLQRGMPAEIAKQISSWKVPGLQCEKRSSRSYPNGTLASAVTGFVTDEGQAAYGLESYYDEQLRGCDGRRQAAQDSLGTLTYRVQAPVDGADLYLSLDRNLQYVAEDALARAVASNDAKQGIVVVMNPQSGAILAMAVMPNFDPNRRQNDDPAVWNNAAISEVYEPGSVFKVLTIAAALDAGVITAQSTYYDSGSITIGGEVIKNSDRAAHGETTIADLLAHSLNVGAAHVAGRMGAIKFYEYVQGFGFTRLTSVDLAYEAAGILRLPGDRDWHESDLGTNSFGQGLSTTPVQMLAAISAVANGGVLMRPYIVERMVQGGKVINTVPQSVRRVVSAEAARQTTDMLVDAVDTVMTAAIVPGYRVAGKSGTSQVATPFGYDPDLTIASYVGYVPAGAPQLAILVILHHPVKEQWGTTAAAPVFREIAEQGLTMLGVPPDRAQAGQTAR